MLIINIKYSSGMQKSSVFQVVLFSFLIYLSPNNFIKEIYVYVLHSAHLQTFYAKFVLFYKK